MKKIFFLFFLIFSLVLIPKSPLVFAQNDSDGSDVPPAIIDDSNTVGIPPGNYEIIPPNTDYTGQINDAISQSDVTNVDEAYTRVQQVCSSLFQVGTQELSSCNGSGFESARGRFGGFSSDTNDACAEFTNDPEGYANCVAQRSNPLPTSEPTITPSPNQNVCGTENELPTPPGPGYSWVPLCSEPPCQTNSQCPANTGQYGPDQPFRNAEDTQWCYNGVCIQARFSEPNQPTEIPQQQRNQLTSCVNACNGQNIDTWKSCVEGCYGNFGNSINFTSTCLDQCYYDPTGASCIQQKCESTSPATTPSPGTTPSATSTPTATPTPFPNNYQIESCAGKSATETVSVIAGRCSSGNGYYYNHCKCKGDNTSAADVTKCTADSPPQRTCGQTNSDPEKQRQEVAYCQGKDADGSDHIGRAVPGSENCFAKCAGETTASGACKGHQYCVWSPDGNHYAGQCQCEANGSGKTCIGSETKPIQPTRPQTPTTSPTPNTTTTPAPTVANDEKPAVTGFSVNRTTILAGDSGLTFSASGGRGRFILSLYGGGTAPTQDNDPKVKCAENILSEECETYDPNGFVNGTAKKFRIRDTGGDYNNLSSTNLSPNAAPTTPGNYYALVVAKYKGLTCSSIERNLIGDSGRQGSCQNTGVKPITVTDASVTNVRLQNTGRQVIVTVTGQANNYDLFISKNQIETDFSNALQYVPTTDLTSGRPYFVGSTTGVYTINNPVNSGAYYVLVNAHSTNSPWSTYDRVCAFNGRVYQDNGNSGGTNVSEVNPTRNCRNVGAQASIIVNPPTTIPTPRTPQPTCRPGDQGLGCVNPLPALPARRQPLIAAPQPVQGVPILSGILNFLSNIFK